MAFAFAPRPFPKGEIRKLTNFLRNQIFNLPQDTTCKILVRNLFTSNSEAIALTAHTVVHWMYLSLLATENAMDLEKP